MSIVHKTPRTRSGKPEPGKVSEMFLEFAQPLTSLEPGGPPDIQALKTAMMLAEMCWNLPVMEKQKTADGVSTRKTFDAAIAQVPGVVGDVLLGLVEDRATTFGEVPFFLSVEVKGTSLSNARIAVEARKP